MNQLCVLIKSDKKEALQCHAWLAEWLRRMALKGARQLELVAIMRGHMQTCKLALGEVITGEALQVKVLAVFACVPLPPEKNNKI